MKSPAANLTDCVSEELRIRCEALRGLLIAEFGFELQEIAAVETAALSDFKKEIEID